MDFLFSHFDKISSAQKFCSIRANQCGVPGGGVLARKARAESAPNSSFVMKTPHLLWFTSSLVSSNGETWREISRKNAYKHSLDFRETIAKKQRDEILLWFAGKDEGESWVDFAKLGSIRLEKIRLGGKVRLRFVKGGYS